MSDTEQMPGVVYHYTSLATLMKIVDSRQLWATSVRYLNDTRERDGFLKSTVELLPSIAKKADLDETALQFLLASLMHKSDFASLPSVVSFSTRSDSLSQWRSYCRDGDGVSIGFDVGSLQGAEINGETFLIVNGASRYLPLGVRLRKVRYMSRVDPSAVKEAVLLLYNKALSDPNPGGWVINASPELTLALTLGRLLEDEAATYKDEDFETEQEVRLILSPVSIKPNLLHFRTAGTALVPYLQVDVPSPDGNMHRSTPWRAITKVCVGPNANLELTADALTYYFQSLSMNVAVEKTNVSFRDW